MDQHGDVSFGWCPRRQARILSEFTFCITVCLFGRLLFTLEMHTYTRAHAHTCTRARTRTHAYAHAQHTTHTAPRRVYDRWGAVPCVFLFLGFCLFGQVCGCMPLVLKSMHLADSPHQPVRTALTSPYMTCLPPTHLSALFATRNVS